MEEKQIIRHTNKELYEKQMEMLKQFFEKGAIDKAQYEKSVNDLTKKMND